MLVLTNLQWRILVLPSNLKLLLPFTHLFQRFWGSIGNGTKIGSYWPKVAPNARNDYSFRPPNLSWNFQPQSERPSQICLRICLWDRYFGRAWRPNCRAFPFARPFLFRCHHAFVCILIQFLPQWFSRLLSLSFSLLQDRRWRQ